MESRFVSTLENPMPTQNDIAKRLAAENPWMTIADAKLIMNTIFSTIGDAIADGKTVRLKRLCTFYTKDLPEREIRGVRLGETLRLPATRALYYYPSQDLNRRFGRGRWRKSVGHHRAC
jgi:integration host factor subunit beta